MTSFKRCVLVGLICLGSLLTLFVVEDFFQFQIRDWGLRDVEVEVDSDGQRTLKYEWHIARHTLPLDGVEKKMILVNGMFPGPTIHGKVGDRVIVNVHNDLEGEETTSVHWHGIKQRGSNAMDGAVGVTQCGIPSGDNLTYSFDLDEPGTYWWHSHVGTQRLDGMFGGLIVKGGDEHYSEINNSYDEEVVVILSDHYHRSGERVLQWYLSRSSGGQEPVPSNGFINGQNVYDCERFMDTELTCIPKVGRHAHFEFHKNKRYRVRIINASAMANFRFSIDEHEFQVIEADSIEIEPVKAHYIPISSGQRYSAIVHTENKNRNSFFMRAEMNQECFNYKNEELDPEIKGVITYKSNTFKDLLKSRESIPSSKKWEDIMSFDMCLDMDERTLQPLTHLDAPEPDQTVVVWTKIVQLHQNNLAPYAYFNRTSWAPSIGAPNLHVELGLVNASMGPKSTKKWGGKQMVVDIEPENVVQLIISNGDESPHPFHLHGHDFWIVKIYEPPKGYIHGQWDPDEHHEYKTNNPIRRDTFTVPRFGHAVIRFKADNPGIWAFHCHILWHLTTGMMMQFNQNHISEKIPQIMLDQCSQMRTL
ncbi:hypothetical protein TRICI_001879 [Trichomonascus ciferrii]|uniref:Multicopper oxidase n=1 Tax=Trichomonascus ciferrii TaxID=44093 RepID=A0A642V7A1_9ASCO|nr:hypothetical protein TRICI_001879 [Trichomonascus ciferrii]